ncbi:leucine zipper domain containing protein [Nosema bombycis CQ1]|nr:leucine zipper domain containing protein [Nosema bombycis CQ1]|eukprot:EOB12171.1 leucine zipper domain containing protein [Nosema bombycis CQ1]
MSLEINELKDAIEDYDRILRNVFDYIKNCICKKEKKTENLVYLFDCLCRLKRQNGEKSSFLKDISYLFENGLYVKNEDIEELTNMLRESLNDMLENK